MRMAHSNERDRERGQGRNAWGQKGERKEGKMVKGGEKPLPSGEVASYRAGEGEELRVWYRPRINGSAMRPHRDDIVPPLPVGEVFLPLPSGEVASYRAGEGEALENLRPAFSNRPGNITLRFRPSPGRYRVSPLPEGEVIDHSPFTLSSKNTSGDGDDRLPKTTARFGADLSAPIASFSYKGSCD
jgi:hypothetical protein